MPRTHSTSRCAGSKQAALALLLTTSALAWAGASSAYAQQLGLRGEVSEKSVQQNRIITGAVPARPQAGQAVTANSDTLLPPTYVPASTSALTEPLDGAAAPATADDPFSERPAAAPKSKSSSATRNKKNDEETPTTANGKPNPTRRAMATDTSATDPNATDTGPAGDELQQRANRRARTVDYDDRQKLDPGVERTGSIEGGDRKPEEEDPFAAVGIRAGSFILRPSLEEGVTATSNADSSFNGSSAVLSETTLRLNAASDWRENSASADGTLTYRKTLSGQQIDDLRGRVDGTLNIDLADDLRAIAKLGYEAAPESASSPVAVEGAISQPLRQTLNGSLGIEKDVGKARFALTGAVQHDIYGDAELSSGGTLSQKDRNATLYTAKLRGGYEISPALTPFVELETGRRVYGQRIDNSGYERSATRFGARAGVELDMGEKLAGEFSAGWLRESIDDDRLEPVSGATVNADLRWSPERGTIVGLSGSTIVEGTTNPGESGSLLYSSRLSLERQIRDNLTGNAALGVDWRRYVGSDARDRTLSAEASLTWWLNRYAGLTTRARTEKLTSNLPGREATTNSIFVGLKLQR
jgi:hypothetical protein